MRQRRMPLAAVLLSAIAAHNLFAGGPSVETEIIAVEKQLFAAIKAKDPAALERLLTDDFILRVPGAPPADRAAFLQNVKAIPVEIVEIWSEDMHARGFGETAVLTGTQLARTRDSAGTTQVSAQAFTDVFVKRNGRWLLALAHSVEIPPPAK